MSARPRDRFMDLVRVAGVLVVVAGHWLVLVPYARNGLLGGRPLYTVQPAFWPLTWVFEVLPLFFFVGGFANYTSFTSPRNGPEGARFRRRRLGRLLGPTFVFLGVWILVQGLLQVLGVGAPGPLRGMRIGQITPFESLWFIGVYLAVVLLSPATIRLHRRAGWWVPAGPLAGVAFTDLVAWRSGNTAWLFLNIPFVWLLPHQLGYFYAEGRLQRLTPGRLLLVAAAGLALTALLTGLPFYGRNLLDSGVAFAGVTAPTLPFALLDVWMVALVLAARGAARRLLRGERAWKAVSRLNSVVMTLFLWHMTAYFAVLAAAAAAGLPLPAGPDATWWLQRPLFLALPVAALAPLVWAFGRFESGGETSPGPEPIGAAA